MRAVRAIAYAAAVAGAATFGVRAQAEDDRDLRSLITAAEAAPPEFASDALIRLSTSSRITSNAQRRELLDEAFVRAYGAQESYRRSALPGIPPDSRQGTDLLAYAAPLTRISLQSRAAQLMASIDPRHARELFEWIDFDVAPTTCEDALVPAVEDYYSALTLIARTGFAGNRADALRFFELYLWQARLPSEMPVIARAVQRFQPNAREAEYLETVFRLILEGGASDPRGFSTSDLDIVSRAADLQLAHRAMAVPGWHVLEAVREYLIAQLKKPRCSDSATESMTPASFNAALARLGAQDEIARIDPDSVRPSQWLGIARIDLYWQTPQARRLHEAGINLRWRGRTQISEKERRTMAWLNQASLFLTAVEQWTGRSEPVARDYFFETSVLFAGLLDLAPPGAVRARAVNAFVEFLRHSDLDRDRRLVFFAVLNRLLDIARGAADRRAILAALDDSHHPVLSLYARLEQAHTGPRP